MYVKNTPNFDRLFKYLEKYPRYKLCFNHLGDSPYVYDYKVRIDIEIRGRRVASVTVNDISDSFNWVEELIERELLLYDLF